MSFFITNRALLRGMLAGAVVLTGAACSRSDRAKSGPDNTAAVVPDTSSNAAQPSNSGAVTGAVSDTATPSDQTSSSNQPTSSAPSNAPRAETAAPSEKDTADSVATDMSAVGSASADVADTAAAGYAEMARDTSTVADQADTAAANGDVALKATVDPSSEANADASAGAGAADSTDNAGRIRPPEDSTEILGEVRVRPPEDSTEILGNVTTNEGDETADEQVVKPEDRETVAVSETPNDEVGAAAIGGEATGADAVALMTREGVRCAVVDPEENQAIRWDMSSTPVALNPCGMGSMIVSRIWTRVE